MKHVYRLLCFVLAFVLLISCVTVFADNGTSTKAGTDGKPPDYAYMDFADSSKTVNMTATHTLTAVTEDGVKGVKTTNATDNRYILCDISDEFLYNIPIYTPLDITVEYLDKGTGKFSISYDSYTPQSEFWATPNIWAETDDYVTLTDTGEVKSYTFHLEYMKLTNQCTSGADFRIGTWGPFMGASVDDVIFKSVKLEKSDYQSLIDMKETKFDEYGNIYGGDMPITFSQTTMNRTSEDVVIEYQCTAVGQETGKTFTHTQTEEIGLNEEKEIKFSMENPGIYDIYDITVKGISKYKNKLSDENAKEYSTEYSTGFSVSMRTSKEEADLKRGMVTHDIQHKEGTSEIVGDLMINSGIKVAREAYNWNQAEKELGKVEIDPVARAQFETLKEKGVEVMLTLWGSHKVYGTPNCVEDYEAYANYCAVVAKELPHIKYFEIWNEHNAAAFVNENVQPECYTEMLKYAYKAIKKVRPDAIVIGLCTANIDMPWIKRVLAAGAYDYMDAYSVHPYEFSGMFRDFKLVQDTEELKAEVRKYGPDKPLYFTEAGFSTYKVNKSQSWNAATGYTYEEQAKNSVLTYAIIDAYDLAEITTHYTLYDRDNDDDVESCWGIANKEDSKIRVPAGAKPAYLALSAMNYFCGSTAEIKGFTGDSLDEDKRFFAFHYYNKKMGKDIMLIQAGDRKGEKVINYKLGCESIDLYDMYGNYTTTIKSDNGIFSLPVKQVPYYAISNFTSFEETYDAATVETNSVSGTCTSKDTAEFVFKKNTNKNLSITVEGGEYLTVAENKGFENDTAKLVVALDKPETSDEEFRVIIKDDDGIIYYNQIHTLNVKAPVTVSFKSENAAANSYTHWRVRVDVKNMSNTSYVSGTTIANIVGNDTYKPPVKTFKDLAPGKSATFLFNLPERVTKSTLNFKTETVLDTDYTDTTTQLIDFGESIYAYNKPTIDGIVSEGEWQGSWIGSDSAKDVKEITDWRGPEDLSFSCTSMWDEDNFYIMAIVTDDIFSVTYSPQEAEYLWKGDSLQVAFDDRAGEDINTMQVQEFTEFGFAQVPGVGDVAYRYKSRNRLETSVVVDTADVKISRNDGYTVYECRVPWSEIFDTTAFTPKDGGKYRFSVLVNDNDADGRRGWIEYMSGIGGKKNAQEFGYINLTK